MHFKLIIALVEDDKTDAVLNAARESGATGATVRIGWITKKFFYRKRVSPGLYCN